MDGKSLNLTAEKLNKLKEIIPEAFTENKVDWEKLKAALGEDIEFKNERYVLNWAGKADAFRVLQSLTTATLVPVKEESVNFDATENIFIEGENLEVLKVLQKSYFSKIKMIYIDPPYNTGNDNFIYPDKFSESREEYLSRIGDKDETGFMTREGLFRKNSKDSGHYHSNWLSMMYPRLFLARNLLRDDGVIFVSIDDNEVYNLRLLMNEVFGEENFVANIVWQKKQSPQNDASYLSDMHDHVLVYAQSVKQTQNDPHGWNRILLPRNQTQNRRYKNPDNDPRGDWASVDCTCNKTSIERPNLYYPIISPNTGNEVYPSTQRVWRYEQATMEKLLKENRIFWGENNNNFPRQKRFLAEVQDGVVPSTWWSREFASDNQAARRELRAIFKEDEGDFSTPKPTGLIKRMLQIAVEGNDIVLDFFAGSATTAHAVLDLNKADASTGSAQSYGNRKFICVQLPEKCDENSEAYKAGYKTIAEIGKERIRRVINKIKNEELKIENEKGKNLFEEANKNNLDLGFKVFKLQESNFKIWRTKIANEEQLVEQLQQHLESLDENANTEDVLYELLLKSGVALTAKIEEKDGFYLVNDTEIALILEKVDKEIIKSVIEAKPQKAITLDRLFNNNDQLKTNTALQMKDAGIEFKVV